MFDRLLLALDDSPAGEVATLFAAALARRTGATEDAERLALDVLELAPGRGRSLAILYEIRKAQ